MLITQWFAYEDWGNIYRERKKDGSWIETKLPNLPKFDEMDEPSSTDENLSPLHTPKKKRKKRRRNSFIEEDDDRDMQAEWKPAKKRAKLQ